MSSTAFPWRPHRTALALALAGLLGALAPAQGVRQFAPQLGKSYLPARSDLTVAVVFGDVDRDGDLDAVAGNLGERSRLLFGDGRGGFVDVTAERMPPNAEVTGGLALGDVDGDGDLDLVVAVARQLIVGGGRNRLYLNDGSGGFTDASADRLPAVLSDSHAAALFDADGDRDLDLMIANAPETAAAQGQNRLYLNDGQGHFSEKTAERMPTDLDRSRDLAVGDVDGDGDLDVMVANDSLAFTSGQNRLYLNDGRGHFADATAARMPARNDDSAAVALGDVDGDGDLDVTFGNRRGNRLYVNIGGGSFLDRSASQLPADLDDTRDVALTDLDGDRDLDLVAANGGQNRIYVNRGNGVFDSAPTATPAILDSTNAVATADLDGDGDGDLLLGDHGQNRLWLNNGQGQLRATVGGSRVPVIPATHDAMAAGDLDGDGDQDLVLGSGFATSPALQLLVNDGRGRFGDETAARLPAQLGSTVAALLRDVDGDGDLDLLASVDTLVRLYVNDGAGRFGDATSAQMPNLQINVRALATGDIDGDGDLDLAVGAVGQNALFLNDGGGTFADATSRLPVEADRTVAVAAADADADGDLDLVFGNDVSFFSPSSFQDRFYRNDGSGRFVADAAALPVALDATKALAWLDADGDGDLDLAKGTAPQPADPGGTRLYRNDGSGIFADVTGTHLPATTGYDQALAVADVDSDGDPDLIVGTAGVNRLLVNQGGRFADGAARMPTAAASTRSLASLDVDGDRDLDLVTGNFKDVLRLDFNRHRQLVTPRLATVGVGFPIEVESEPGYGTTAHVVQVFLATAALPQPLSLGALGTLYLQPPLLPLTTMTIPATARQATWTLAIPHQPALAGVELHLQAWLGGGPEGNGLTTSTRDVVGT